MLKLNMQGKPKPLCRQRNKWPYPRYAWYGISRQTHTAGSMYANRGTGHFRRSKRFGGHSDRSNERA